MWVRPHYAARQNAIHSSFAARQKLFGICRQCNRVHMKKKFFADLLQVTKNYGTKSVNFVWFFFSNWLIPFWNPLLIICRAASFDETDNLPIKFLGRAASNGMPQPRRHNVHIYLWHGATFAARPWCPVPLCAAWHSVNVPLQRQRRIFVEQWSISIHSLIEKLWIFPFIPWFLKK